MITPQAPNGIGTQTVLPKLDPSVRFVYLHHRSNWEVIIGSDGEGHLVPVVVAFRFQPGVSGVLQIGEGQAVHGDPSIALSQKAADGWIQIPEEQVRAWGELRPSYCVRYLGHKGSAHLEAWWKLSDLGGGRVEKEWDQDGWISWKESLVSRGIVNPISDAIRKALLNDYTKNAQKRRVNPNHAISIAHSEQYEQRARACVVQPAPKLAFAPEAAPVEVVTLQPTEPPLWLANLNNMLASLSDGLRSVQEQQTSLSDGLRSVREQQAAQTAPPPSPPKAGKGKPPAPAAAPPPAPPAENSSLIED
jgi:hypothetical protein